MGDHLVRDPAGVPADAQGVECDASVESPRQNGLVRIPVVRPVHRRSTRFRSWARTFGNTGTGAVLNARSYGVFIHLPPRSFGSYQETGSVGVIQFDFLAAAKTTIDILILVIDVCEGERVPFPHQETGPIPYGEKQKLRIPQSRQVEVAGEVVHELPYRHMVSSPERHPIELHAQQGSGIARVELIAPDLPARPFGERALAREARGLPVYLGLR